VVAHCGIRTLLGQQPVTTLLFEGEYRIQPFHPSGLIPVNYQLGFRSPVDLAILSLDIFDLCSFCKNLLCGSPNRSYTLCIHDSCYKDSLEQSDNIPKTMDSQIDHFFGCINVNAARIENIAIEDPLVSPFRERVVSFKPTAAERAS
jgi:hypothetical protein